MIWSCILLRSIVWIGLFSLLLVVFGSAYSLYFENLKVNVSVSTAGFGSSITGFKVFRCCHCCCHSFSDNVLSNGNRSLIIHGYSCHSCCCHHATTWYWVGLTVVNDGELPIVIDDIEVSVDGSYSTISYTVYMYGPYSENDTLYPWRYVCPYLLPYPTYTTNIQLNPGETTVIWIKLTLTNTTGPHNITVTPKPKPWNT